MSGEHDEAARLDALERRAAHQDRVIDELNDAVTAQWTVIDGLQRRLAGLASRLEETRRPAQRGPPAARLTAARIMPHRPGEQPEPRRRATTRQH